MSIADEQRPWSPPVFRTRAQIVDEALERLRSDLADIFLRHEAPAVEGVAVMVEKMRRKVQVMPATGGGTISFGGESSHYITDDGHRYVNPDGPEAADLLTTLNRQLTASAAELAALRAQVGEAVGLIRTFVTDWDDDRNLEFDHVDRFRAFLASTDAGGDCG